MGEARVWQECLIRFVPSAAQTLPSLHPQEQSLMYHYHSTRSTPARPSIRIRTYLYTFIPCSFRVFEKNIEKGATPAGATPAARRCGISGNDEEDRDLDGYMLNTPAWGDGPDTPVAGTRPKHTRSGAASGSKESNLTSLYAFVPCCAGGSSML